MLNICNWSLTTFTFICFQKTLPKVSAFHRASSGMESFPMTFALCLVFSGMVFSEENRIPNPFLDIPVREETPRSNNHWNMPSDNPLLRHLESSPGQVIGRVLDDDVESLRQRLTHEDWNQFTPSPITEVQCHIEFQVTKSLPGRCTKLGGRIPACQTEEYVEIDYVECR